MENMVSIIKRHDRKIIGNSFKNTEEGCNCRDKNKCPLENKCLSTILVYKACASADENTEVKNYIGLAEGTFKQIFNPPGTKGFGTHTKHQGGGVEKDPPSISRTRNATNLKPLEGLGVSFKVSKNFKLV